jgi:AraC family transcriptional regulator
MIMASEQDLLPPRFVDGKELLIAGLNATYTFETRVNIPLQWQRFAPPVGKISYGVCWNYKPGCGFDYLSGIEVSDLSALPADFSHIRLPAQRYAVFTHNKHVSFRRRSMRSGRNGFRNRV